MSRSKKAQFLFIGSQWDGFHHIVEVDADGRPAPNQRVMKIQPLTQADWKAQEVTLKAEYDLYVREALTDKDRKLTWVYIIEGANLIGALIDGYRRKP